MLQLYYTLYTKSLLFLSILLFITSYLFTTLLPAFTGTILLIFLIYTKTSFKENIGEITIKREILEKLRFVNHPIHIKTTIQNQGKTLNITVEDILPDSAIRTKGENKRTQLIKPGEEITLEYQVQFTSRGTQTFSGVDLKLSDTSNLYFYKKRQAEPTELMTHSDPEEIKKAKRVTTKEHIEITMPSRIGAETQYEMEDIRTYLPGDRLKDIDWKATSRLQKLMTRLFQKKEVVDAVILLDCSRSMRRTTGTKSKIDHATNIAVHLTKVFQSVHQPVGLVAYDEFKTIKNVAPTNMYHMIFEELTDLPGQIQTSDYDIKNSLKTIETKKDNPVENQQFISTIFPFLAKGKRQINHPSQASGIYEAIRILFMNNKSKLLIILTDLETNLQSLYSSISLAHARKYNIWLLTSYSPYYNLEAQQLVPEQLEEIYTSHTEREKTLIKLKKLNIEVVELTPSMEGAIAIEKIRGK
jgi:uncharacterized protein (DUF58 family)